MVSLNTTNYIMHKSIGFSFSGFMQKYRFSFFSLFGVRLIINYWSVISPEGGNRIVLITTIFDLYARAILFIVFIFLGVFYSHTGVLTQFLHRLGTRYLVYFLWLENSGIVYRLTNVTSKAVLEIIQEDSLLFRLFFIYATATLAIFFFGVADRYFLSKMGRMEFPLLLLFINFGGLFAIRRHTFIDMLIALERVTLASYVLVTFERTNRFSTYAGVQYFILGSLPSAILLLAFSLFYLQSGSMAFQDLDLFYNTMSTSSFMIDLATQKDFYRGNSFFEAITFEQQVIFTTNQPTITFFSFFPIEQIEGITSTINPVNSRSVRALFFLFFNFFFKITVAPFHVWAPSVYGKAPTASVAFLSIYSKRLIFFIRYKLLSGFLHVFSSITIVVCLSLGLLSIFVGILGAFSEKAIKSFFVYSSIGHVGFILIGLGLNTLEGSSAAITYLAVYILTSFVMWFLLLLIGRNKTHLSQFSELQQTDPVLALRFAFLIFSISGIPPLGGFFIKLDILSAVQDNSHFFINYVLFVFTVISFFYYLRVIKIMFFDTQTSIRSGVAIKASQVSSLEYTPNVGRIWIRSVITIILATYLCLVQKPLMVIQAITLGSLY